MLEIRVVHGSLEDAAYPIVVGHHQGMPIGGAEGKLDGCLGGRLTERLQLGAYAELEGTAIAVPGPPECTPPSALVLGLGPSGEVNAAKVARAMTQAALLRALSEAADDDADEPVTVGLSSVLVGANPLDGISLQRSLAALVDGVVAAVHELSASPRLSSKVRIGTLEIVELYSVRAEAAFRALESLETLIRPPGAGLELRPHVELEKRPGGVEGDVPADYSAGAWLRVDIRAAQADAEPAGYRRLEFTSAARRARADRLEQTLEEATVEGLIANAVSLPRPDPQVANTLYELLLPNELKSELQAADNLQLLLDPETARYPWETLAARRADDELVHLAEGAGLLRQFADSETRNARFSVRRPTGRRALVIGNPPAGNDRLDLPGAAEEARQVAELLARDRPAEAKWDVHALTWDDQVPAEPVNLPPVDDAQSWAHIINALYRHEYRVVHIAAHGRFNGNDPARSGVLIGPDRYLTAQTVAQLAAVPELVFLNCCHLARIADSGATALPEDVEAHQLAASVARALMAIGVRAVVAAGWAVEDAGAVAFATRFYEEMLDKGRGFGVALREARQAARNTSDSMTWAAYQCYGDPEFRLRSTVDA